MWEASFGIILMIVIMLGVGAFASSTKGKVRVRRATTPEVTGRERAKEQRVSLEVYQHDWIPGFAAFHDDGSVAEGARAHVVLNLGSLLTAIKEGDLDKRDLPYLVAESLMHEAIHVLEAWANVEFSEDRVEELLTKYREKYERATIWEYTGAEPKENHEPAD